MILKYIYLIIKARLQQIEGIDEVTWFMQQYFPQEGEMYTENGIYIEFLPTPTETEGVNYQAGDFRCIIHLAQACLYDDDKRVTDATIDHFEKLAEIFKKLNGKDAMISELPDFADLAGTEDDFFAFNKPERVNISPDHRFKKTLVTKQQFDFTAYDSDAVQKLQKINNVTLKTNKG